MHEIPNVDEGPLTIERGTENRTEQLALERVGQTLKGKWRLQSILGIGGSSAVYSAIHLNGNTVAIKMLHQHLSDVVAIRECFVREAFVSNKVDHPGVVRVFDEDVAEDGTMFLVMELFDGKPISSRWEDAGRRLPIAETLWVADQLLMILEAVHGKEIIHCDIKPDNLLLTSAGCVKLVDFGLARLGIGDSGATTRGEFLGTPGFAAPEQARGQYESVDCRTDLWAVGATILSLLTGQSIHDGGDTQSQIIRTALDRPMLSRRLDRTLPKALAHFIDHALAFLPENRFQTAVEMRNALQETFLQTLGSPMSTRRPTGSQGAVGLPAETIVFDPPVRTRLRSRPAARSMYRRAVAVCVASWVAFGYSAAREEPEGTHAQAHSEPAPSNSVLGRFALPGRSFALPTSQPDGRPCPRSPEPGPRPALDTTRGTGIATWQSTPGGAQ